ncbi:MAG: hypothetical protein E7409_00165 [Ruminococcaceae bacterium]|nr:hypothetical protein [Oscillospiraceae bacterium]
MELLYHLQGNVNRQVECALLNMMQYEHAYSLLLLVYAKEKQSKKILSMYDAHPQRVAHWRFEQLCSVFSAYCLAGRMEEAAHMICARPHLICDEAICDVILQSPPEQFGETVVAACRAWKQVAGRSHVVNDFEQALVEGDAEKINYYCSEQNELTALGYEPEEIERILLAEPGEIISRKGDYYSAERMRLFLGDRSLLALRYCCYYLVTHNVAYALNIMKNNGLNDWITLCFESNLANCCEKEGIPDAYAWALLHSRMPADALDVIENLAEQLTDVALKEHILSDYDLTGYESLENLLNKKEEYRPNAFEQAVIDLSDELNTYLQDKGRLSALGYTDAEIERISSSVATMPKGGSDAEIGTRLHRLQENKNGLAERYLRKECKNHRGAAQIMLHLYCDEGRYAEALALCDEVPDFLTKRVETTAHYMDALYYAKQTERFLQEYFSGECPYGKRHKFFCASLLIQERAMGKDGADERFEQVAEEIAKTAIFNPADIAMLSDLVTELKNGQEYAAIARICGGAFSILVLYGNLVACKSMSEVGNMTIQERNMVVDEAIRLGLDMTLPVYWSCKSMAQVDEEIVQRWYRENAVGIEQTDSFNSKFYSVVLDMFPEKHIEILVKNIAYANENDTISQMIIQALSQANERGDDDSLRLFLNEMSGNSFLVCPDVLDILDTLCKQGRCRTEVVNGLAETALRKKENAAYRFLHKHLDTEVVFESLRPEWVQDFKNGYMAYAAKTATREVMEALYDFLYIADDVDATILSYLLMMNLGLWNSSEERKAFAQLCESRGDDLSGDRVVSAFERAISDKNPQEIATFAKKWEGFIERSEEDVMTELTRVIRNGICRTGDMGTVVCAVIAGFRYTEVWQTILPIYETKSVLAQANIRYAIAKTSPAELRNFLAFTQNNHLTMHHVYGLCLMLEHAVEEAEIVNVCRELTGICADASEIDLPAEVLETIYEQMKQAMEGKNRATILELLYAARELGFCANCMDLFVDRFADQLKADPWALIGLMFTLYFKGKKTRELADRLRQILIQEVPESFSAKNFAVNITEPPEKFLVSPVRRCAAQMFIPNGGMINVEKMYQYLYRAFMFDSKLDGTEGIGGAELLLSYFPGDGLLYEILYYLKCAHTVQQAPDNAEISSIYHDLFCYLDKSIKSEDLIANYTKMLLCAVEYASVMGFSVAQDGIPATREEVMHYFDAAVSSDTLKEEVHQFAHIVDMMEKENELFQMALLAGLTGNWREFVCSPLCEEISSRQIGELSDFINKLMGREKLLRSVAGAKISGKTIYAEPFLRNDELVRVRIATDALQSDHAKKLMERWLRSTLVDKGGAVTMAQNALQFATPDIYAQMIPAMRLLVPNTILLNSLALAPKGYLRAAAGEIVQQCRMESAQTEYKDYRDFLRSLCNLLFDRGDYEQVYPILEILCQADEAEKARKKGQEKKEVSFTRKFTKRRKWFCGLVLGKEREIEKLETEQQWRKFIDLFAGVFASPRAEDLSKIAPALNKLQKRVCVAVFYALVNRFSDFEAIAREIWKAHRGLGETVFWYGRLRFSDASQKETCMSYITSKDARQPFFISPAPNPAIYRLNIAEIIGLSKGMDAAWGEEVLYQAPALEMEILREMSFAKPYMKKQDELSKGVISCEVALKNFDRHFDRNIDTKNLVEKGKRVLGAGDFATMDIGVLNQFFFKFGMVVYREERKNGKSPFECREYAKDFLRCLETMSGIDVNTKVILCDILLDILRSEDELCGIDKLFGRKTDKLLSLLKSSGDAELTEKQECLCKVLELLGRLYDVDPINCTVEDRLSQTRAIKDEMVKMEQTVSENLLRTTCSHLSGIIEKKENELRQTALFHICLDSIEIHEGNRVTGYVHNYGLQAASRVELTVIHPNGRKQKTTMEKIHPGRYAPFGFYLLGATCETQNHCVIRLAYTVSDERKEKTESFDVSVTQPQKYPLFNLDMNTVREDNIDAFVGRHGEISRAKAMFFEGEDNGIGRARSPRNVQSLLVNGPKRVGKSSMLHMIGSIVSTIPDLWCHIYLDAQSIDSTDENPFEILFIRKFTDSWEERYGKVRNTDEYKEIIQNLPKGNFSTYTWENFLRAFHQKFANGRKILCFVDEIESAFRVPDSNSPDGKSTKKICNMFQYMSKTLPNIISLIVCGSDDLIGVMFDMENATQFFQILKSFPIGRMTKDEYAELLDFCTEKTGTNAKGEKQSRGVVPDELAREELWRLTRGQVYYTKHFYNAVVSLFRGEGEDFTDERDEMHLYDVYSAYSEIVRGTDKVTQGLRGIFGKRDEILGEDRISRYNRDESMVMEALSTLAKVPDQPVSYLDIAANVFENAKGIPVDVTEGLRRLDERTFVEGSITEGYQFTSEMYRMEFTNSSPAELYFSKWEEAEK